jgi:threonine dehydratase
VTGDTKAQHLVLTRDDIARTYDTIGPYVRRTPVVELDLSGPVTLKLEQLQCAGSFKARGAFTNLLLRDVTPAGVAAASGGNHGVAVAYAAHRLGIPARIFVPTVSSPAKIERIRQLADLVVVGDRYADALEAAERWIATSGAMSVHAYDHRETILGQATLALELDNQAGPLDTVLVPVGGGGLIAGIASYFAGTARVIGVEPDGAPTLFRARAAGAPVDAPAGSIAATWSSRSPRPTWRTWCWWTMTRSGARSARSGRPRASRPSPPPRSASRPCWPARTSPRLASGSRSSSAART